MTHANPQLEGNPRRTQALARPPVSSHTLGESMGGHRLVSSLPPWPVQEPPFPAHLRGRRRVIEYGGLALATICFAAAVCAGARIFYLAEEHGLGLGMFTFLAAVLAGFTRLGCLIVLAIGRWLERARALNAPLSSPRSDSDPSPRPPPRDSRC